MDHRRVLYVGGLEENVTEAILHAAFIPFGDIKDVQIPLDQATQSNRGFGFVQFNELEDAEAAKDNMDQAELYGRVLRVNVARPQKTKLGSNRPVWADADDWYRNSLKEDGLEDEDCILPESFALVARRPGEPLRVNPVSPAFSSEDGPFPQPIIVDLQLIVFPAGPRLQQGALLQQTPGSPSTGSPASLQGSAPFAGRAGREEGADDGLQDAFSLMAWRALLEQFALRERSSARHSSENGRDSDEGGEGPPRWSWQDWRLRRRRRGCRISRHPNTSLRARNLSSDAGEPRVHEAKQGEPYVIPGCQRKPSPSPERPSTIRHASQQPERQRLER